MADPLPLPRTTVSALMTSMRKHPGTAEVLELLELAEGSDEFDRALALVRDCFSPRDTLRGLARTKLRGLMAQRRALVLAYEAAVLHAARQRGAQPASFIEAAAALGSAFDALRQGFDEQMAQLMNRSKA